MAAFNFNMIPKSIPKVSTKFRRIVTKLPVPESLETLKGLSRYESRSMHGQLPVVWDRAVDFQVYDRFGNRWIDFTSTIFVTNAGHGNQQIVKSLKALLDKPLLHTYTFASEPRLKLLKRLTEVVPIPRSKAFLVSAGTEATECAVKLMRMHGEKINPDKNIIVSFKGATHGRTMGAEMLKGDPKSSAWIGHKDPNMYHLPFPYPWGNEKKNWASRFIKDIAGLEAEGLKKENICGFIIESYLGWGALFYPVGYIKALADFAKEIDAVITFDEIQGGFGRTGKWFVFEHYGVKPDLVCLGKGISSSLPLAAVVGRADIMDLPDVGSMSSTHSANPLSSAACLANIEFIEKKELVKESERKGRILHDRLKKLKAKYPKRIFYIGGKGLIAGVVLKDPRTGKPDGLFASKVCEKAMQKGLLMVHTGRESIKIGPPLTIPDGALKEGLDVLEESFAEIDREDAL